MAHPLHHIHLRKRTKKKNHQHFCTNAKIKLLDRLIIGFGLFNGLATLPQVLEIWVGKDATGVSLITWSYYVISSILLFIYGVVHKDKPIIVTYSIGTVMYAIIVAGVLIYG